jgi:hypothetical protein
MSENTNAPEEKNGPPPAPAPAVPAPEEQPPRKPLAAFVKHFRRFFRGEKREPAVNEPLPQERLPKNKPAAAAEIPWIGVDLDGTLARSGRWRGYKHIGAPVPLMMARVRFWLKNGLTVKIFTARAGVPEAIPPIKRWLAKHGLPELEITNTKDFAMVEFWDDRAVQVVQNTGRPFLSLSIMGRPRAPIFPDEAAGGTFHLLPLAGSATPPQPSAKGEAPDADTGSHSTRKP